MNTSKNQKKEGKKIIYMDETWVNAHHNSNYRWVDEDHKGGWKVPSGKRNRLIMVHAGSREGWVNNEMNISHFMEWWNTQLLPNIPVHSAIALDNASYHNGVTEKVPTKSSTKKVMKEWLDKHNIPYQRTDLKKDLFRLIQQQNSKPKYLTDVSAAELGMFFGFLLHTVSLTQLSSHGQLSKDMWPKTTKNSSSLKCRD